MFTIDTATPTLSIQPTLDTKPDMGWMSPSLDWGNLRDGWLVGWLATSFEGAASLDQAWAISYAGAIAAGTIVRLRRVPRDEAHKSLQAILAGQEPHNPSRTWARSLTPAQVLSISVMFQARCLEWLEEAQSVVEKVDPDSSRWRESYLDLLHRADDLASVRWVLVTVGQADDAADFALDLVYEMGRKVVQDLPAVPSLGNDERLYRAVLSDPSAWWGQPVFDAGLLIQFDPEE